MKVIKSKYIIFVLGLMLYACSDEDPRTNFSDSDESFVRFSVQLNNEDLIVTAPDIPPSSQEITEYSYPGVFAKLPVKLSKVPSPESVTCQFVIEDTNLIEGVDYEVFPANKMLVFQENNLIDTVYIKLNNRLTEAQSMRIRLNSISNPNISLGYPRTENPLDEFSLTFETSELFYEFDQKTKILEGNLGEEFLFKVLFPHGYLDSEITDEALLSASNSIDYTLERVRSNPDFIEYRFTLQEDLSNPDTSFSEVIELNSIDGYSIGSENILSIGKGRPATATVSPSFFNTSDPFFRLFGERWRYDTADDICEWGAWNVFAVPVEVTPNGIFDLNGDGYHDEQIGFVSPNAPIGTNPFDVRRIFNGESVNSPGLNLPRAIEFIPEELTNGEYSTTNGTINVIPQTMILIRSSDDTEFQIPIQGSGTYELIDQATDLWRMDFTVTYDLTNINSDPEYTAHYVLFNSNGQPEPEPINVDCADAIDL